MSKSQFIRMNKPQCTRVILRGAHFLGAGSNVYEQDGGDGWGITGLLFPRIEHSSIHLEDGERVAIFWVSRNARNNEILVDGKAVTVDDVWRNQFWEVPDHIRDEVEEWIEAIREEADAYGFSTTGV